MTVYLVIHGSQPERARHNTDSHTATDGNCMHVFESSKYSPNTCKSILLNESNKWISDLPLRLSRREKEWKKGEGARGCYRDSQRWKELKQLKLFLIKRETWCCQFSPSITFSWFINGYYLHTISSPWDRILSCLVWIHAHLQYPLHSPIQNNYSFQLGFVLVNGIN